MKFTWRDNYPFRVLIAGARGFRRLTGALIVVGMTSAAVGCGGDGSSSDSEASPTPTVAQEGGEFVPGVPEIPEEEAEAQQEAVEIGLLFTAAVRDEDYDLACDLHVDSVEYDHHIGDGTCEVTDSEGDDTPNNGTSSQFGERFYDYLREGSFTELCTMRGPDLALKDPDTDVIAVLLMDQTTAGIQVDSDFETTEQELERSGVECDGQIHPQAEG